MAAGLALTLGVAFVAPASAQTPTPATQGTASAYGLSATVAGVGAVPPTPAVSVTTPGVQELTTVPVVAPPLAINATLNARAECQVNPTVAATLAAQTPNNCRGDAKTEGLDVLLSAGGPSLVSADVIEAEAVARCVAGQGQVASGYKLLGLQVAGQDLGTPLTSTLQPVLELVRPTGALAGLVQVAQNEVTKSGDRIAVNGLHVRVLPVGAGGLPIPDVSDLLPDLGLPIGATAPEAAVDIIISHAEARMPTPCGVAAPAGPAAAPDLGGGPADLPRTGANQMPAVPLALGMLATAVVLHRVNRRARRASD